MNGRRINCIKTYFFEELEVVRGSALKQRLRKDFIEGHDLSFIPHDIFSSIAPARAVCRIQTDHLLGMLVGLIVGTPHIDESGPQKSFCGSESMHNHPTFIVQSSNNHRQSSQNHGQSWINDINKPFFPLRYSWVCIVGQDIAIILIRVDIVPIRVLARLGSSLFFTPSRFIFVLPLC